MVLKSEESKKIFCEGKLNITTLIVLILLLLVCAVVVRNEILNNRLVETESETKSLRVLMERIRNRVNYLEMLSSKVPVTKGNFIVIGKNILSIIIHIIGNVLSHYDFRFRHCILSF